MRNWLDIITEGSQDHEHAEALKKTGYWGKKGAGCIVLARDTGRILLAHRSPYDPSIPGPEEGSTWGGWGGAIDSNESPEVAARRELREECGYHGHFETVPLYVYKAPSGNFRYYNFLAVVDNEFEPKLDWENQGFRWVEFGSWPQPLHFGMKALFADHNSMATIRDYVNAIKTSLDKKIGQRIYVCLPRRS